MSLVKIIEFATMGGYAFYVWTSVAAFLITFVSLWLIPHAKLKKNKTHE